MYMLVLYGNIDRTIVRSLHSMFNSKIGWLDCRLTTSAIGLPLQNKCESLLSLKSKTGIEGVYTRHIHTVVIIVLLQLVCCYVFVYADKRLIWGLNFIKNTIIIVVLIIVIKKIKSQRV